MGFIPVSTGAAYAEKEYTIKSYHYLTVDGKDVNLQAKANNISHTDIKVTMVLPKQNKNGDWLAYGFTSREALNAFIEKDKQKLQNKVNMMGSGSCCTDFYESKNKGGQYIYWRDGFKNLPSSWNDRISSLSTASPSSSYSTTLWEHTSSQGYGKGVSFRHSDWYGKTANMASDWDNKASAIEIK
ncbi:hypothetical protein CIB87_05875 [Priestia megaterium]|uniref:Uncharacterized protein n=2 Tax=Priestia megaterium TaxID=1404 RepID=A0AA86LX11_PRIMG|nr:hypothetical protein [Priestia megaterium]AXI32714.1 hypothetical protein CIB87_05875 [Priestia megaterium]